MYIFILCIFFGRRAHLIYVFYWWMNVFVCLFVYRMYSCAIANERKQHLVEVLLVNCPRRTADQN